VSSVSKGLYFLTLPLVSVMLVSEWLNEVTTKLNEVTAELNSVTAELNEVTAEITKCPGSKFKIHCFASILFYSVKP
jgi:hypothetical protein